MTYSEFVRESVSRQLAVIRAERKRIRKASTLFAAYQRDMLALGLHPLTQQEISDRDFQLLTMESRVHETHGDSETMRIIYEGGRHSKKGHAA